MMNESNRVRKSAKGTAAFSIALAMTAVGVASAADLTVSAGSPKVMTAAESATYYNSVAVNDDLTIDGANGACLTNSSSIAIGASATHPVTIVVTNGAKWVVKTRQTMTFSGKGGTIIVSSLTAPDFAGGSAVDMVIGRSYPNAIGTVGHYTDVILAANAEAADGVMDIARLLPNGTASFRNVKNSNPNVAARILFEGGTHWLMNEDSSIKTRFTVENGARIVLESVEGKPIELRSHNQGYTLLKGVGKLETNGAGDFMLNARSKVVVTLSTDEGGEILWNHTGRTCLRGKAIFTIGTDNILPFGSGTGPIVFSNPDLVNAENPTTLDLNGKTVTVNGLSYEGTSGKFNVITNSSATMATLIINVETNAILSGLIGDKINFAANAISNIRLGKTGAGTLTIDKIPDVAGFDVLEGQIVGNTAFNALTHGASTSSFVLGAGTRPLALAADAGDGTAVFSNQWAKSLTVRSGTASIENGSRNILAEERLWRPTKSQFGSVAVDSGILKVARGCLSATNIAVAAGAELHISGVGGMTNRVDFYTAELSDRYLRFIFKESANKLSFGLNYLVLRAKDGIGEFSRTSSGVDSDYVLNESAATASSLGPGEYMYSCQNGLIFVNETRGSGNCVYSKDGLTTRWGWGGVIINENMGLSLDSQNSWVTLTIRLRDGATSPLVGYSLLQDWTQDKLTVWEVQASVDGTTWRTVDERTKRDIYSREATSSSDPEKEGYGWFNNGEPFGWRSLAADNAFNCAGTVRVDDGGILDLSCVPDANISIKSLTVDVPSGGGTIVKFRPAEDGVLNITGLVGELPNRYALPLTLSNVSNIDNLKTWKVAVDGVVARKVEVLYSDGALIAHAINGFVIVVR